jgi:hypothetical protein
MLFEDGEIRDLYSILEQYFSKARTHRDISEAARELISLLQAPTGSPGTFFPTKSARIGNSRWHRSMMTASWIALGPSQIDLLVEGRAHCSSRIQLVVHEDDDLVVDAGRHVGPFHDRLVRDHLEFVPVERDVERAGSLAVHADLFHTRVKLIGCSP